MAMTLSFCGKILAPGQKYWYFDYEEEYDWSETHAASGENLDGKYTRRCCEAMPELHAYWRPNWRYRPRMCEECWKRNGFGW